MMAHTTLAVDRVDPLAAEILLFGYGSSSSLDQIDGLGAYFASEPQEVKRRVLAATSWLLDHSLVSLYSVDRSRLPGDIHVPWVGTTGELIARLDAVYVNEAADWHTWGFSCWYINTDAGDELAERLPPSSLPDDD